MKRIALGLFAVLLALAPVRAQVNTVWPAPQGAQTIPITVSATGTTTGVTITLPAVSGKTTYICGMVATSAGSGTASVVNLTVSGLPNTLNFTYIYVSSGQGLLGWAIPNCIPASAPNTAIVITLPAGGVTTTQTALSAWGYQN